MAKGKSRKVQEQPKEEAPVSPVVEDTTVETRKRELIALIQVGMPTVDEMQTMPLGVLRKQREWEKKTRPYIEELFKIMGKAVSIEKYRPGRVSC